MVPKGWKSVLVSEICSLKNGHGFTPEVWDTHGLPIIRIQNLNGSTTFNYFSGEPEEDWLVKPGQMLFAWAGTKGVSFGPTIWRGETGVLNQHIFKVFPRDHVDQLWLYYSLQLVTQRIEAKAHGFKATLVHVKKSEIDNQVVSMPPLPEQQAIVQILKTWERAIASVEALIDTSEKQVRGLKQHLFSPRNSSKLRAGWDIKQLSDMADVYDGTHITPDYKDSGVPFYTVEHLTKNDFSTTRFIAREVFERENERVRIDKGDVLMTRIGDVGTPRYIDWDVEASFYVSLALIKARPPLNAHYLHHYIRTRQFQRELYQRTIHVAFPKKINLGEIGKCLVAFPSPTEQERLASILALAERDTSNLKRQLTSLLEEKRGLMRQLLTGERRVNVTDAVAQVAVNG
jgi:type I restriction enzyme S subunit